MGFLNVLLSLRARPVTRPIKWALSVFFWSKFYRQFHTALNSEHPRIFYFLVPPDRLKNLGDHAQRVVILAWMRDHFPGTQVIPLDKDQSTLLLKRLKRYVRKDDVIALHSGGNMGDNGLWSERARRAVVSAFPSNRIVSLPQTISFSDSPRGRAELEESKRIYEAHRDLVIYARDRASLEFGSRNFKGTEMRCAPDFVLRWDAGERGVQRTGKILACLRNDEESILSARDRQHVLNRTFDREVVWYDTTLPDDYSVQSWETELEAVLDYFAQFDLLVTDRFHGLIFGVLTRTPVVVLGTTNHKLTSAVDWFDSVGFVELAESLDQVVEVAQRVEQADRNEIPDWDGLYFDGIVADLSAALRTDSVEAVTS